MRRGNARVIRIALVVGAVMFLFGFACVPIYRIVCTHVLGIKLEEGPASAGKVDAYKVDATREVTVEFVGNVNSALPWQFAPEAVRMTVHPGAMTLAWYDARNVSARAITGHAVPSVAPQTASLYFNKVECFCFTDQTLQAGESRRMPVRFVVDPRLPANVKTLTLSYTFYENQLAERRAAQAAAPAAPAG
ncbi:MAG: cytochrome c oxidase assembly protein [Mizugakiibacter sp.]|uniref:cytochrome c oxidase assembly protein n=1 Tax=Mizugakiibacter sp. TaxID=1972610 RepID=UPI0032104003